MSLGKIKCLTAESSTKFLLLFLSFFLSRYTSDVKSGGKDIQTVIKVFQRDFIGGGMATCIV